MLNAQTALSMENTTMNRTAMVPALNKIMQDSCKYVDGHNVGVVSAKDDGISGGEAPKSDLGQGGKAGFLEELPLRKCYLDKDLKYK